MPLSPADRALVEDMKQRELHVKRRQRAADAILYRQRRFRLVCGVVGAVVLALVVLAVLQAVVGKLPEHSNVPLARALTLALGAALGAYVVEHLLRTSWGRRLLAWNEGRLRRRYSADLHAGRRWLPFYYEGEDIAAYVGQILYFVDEEQRFDSVRAALEFARQNRRESTRFAARARAKFDDVAALTNVLVVASTDAAGRPSSRVMRFVKSGRPGVWYMTTAPDGPKVPELDLGRVALVAVTPTGSTIGSNLVRIRRAPLAFSDVLPLYDAQVPGYADGMTDDELQHELVYELTLESATVETWLDREVAVFAEPEAGER